MTERIPIQVVLALPASARIVDLEVPLGTTLLDAVRRSRLLETLAPESVQQHDFGIFGASRAADTLLAAGDRVEIYRPLALDAKALRRRRAMAQKSDSTR